MRSLIVLLPVLFYSLLYADINVPDKTAERLPVTVYYESQSPFSMKFFAKKLMPTWMSLKDYICLQLKPIAQKMNYTDGSWKFKCFHGEEECYYNKYHACALQYSEAPQDRRIMFVGCLMKKKNESIILEECSKKFLMPEEEIQKCAESPLGDTYLSNNTGAAMSNKPPIKHVPTVVINGTQLSKQDCRNIFEVLCEDLNFVPPSCSELFRSRHY